MPRLTGLQAAQELADAQAALRLLMLSMHENEQFFFEALRAGASGYVLKTAADRDLVDACRAAMRGEAFLYAGRGERAGARLPQRARRGEAATRRAADRRASWRSSSSSPRATPATRSPSCW